jgi:hypothetical protein
MAAARKDCFTINSRRNTDTAKKGKSRLLMTKHDVKLMQTALFAATANGSRVSWSQDGS